MSGSNSRKQRPEDKILEALGRMAEHLLVALSAGLKKINFSHPFVLAGLVCIPLFCNGVAQSNLIAETLNRFWPDTFGAKFVSLFAKVDNTAELIFMLGVTFSSILIGIGLPYAKEFRRYAKALKRLNLRSGDGETPRLESIIRIDQHKKKLIIHAPGIGADRFEAKAGDLRASFGVKVENVKASKRPFYVEIFLNSFRLPTHLSFYSSLKELDTPYSFVAGISEAHGLLRQSLPSLPHMITAGVTGGGKSNFMHNLVLGLLKTGPKLQLFCLDMKRGVEFMAYQSLPNVKVASNEEEALSVLKAVDAEMERRFKYLEEIGETEIDTERDKLDRIVICIDEASLLYQKRPRHSEFYQLSLDAKTTTDRLAKLGRIAGISLVICTQRISAQVLDSNILTNCSGRMCFRMPQYNSSILVLGNKAAAEIEDIPGRAVWGNGNDCIEVQTPYVKDTIISGMVKAIYGEFKRGERANHQAMLGGTSKTGNKPKGTASKKMKVINETEEK